MPDPQTDPPVHSLIRLVHDCQIDLQQSLLIADAIRSATQPVKLSLVKAQVQVRFPSVDW